MKNFKLKDCSRLKAQIVLIVFLSSVCQSGCSLFFGNVKPVEERSTSYGISDLSLLNSDWIRIENSPDITRDTTEGTPSGIPDIAFQSKKTASIISINSACKHYDSDRKETLKELTHELLLGINDLNSFDEKTLTVAGSPALQTTVQGKINQEKMTLRTVVIQKNKCIYDLMYVSRPNRFTIHEADFSGFISSLRLK